MSYKEEKLIKIYFSVELKYNFNITKKCVKYIFQNIIFKEKLLDKKKLI